MVKVNCSGKMGTMGGGRKVGVGGKGGESRSVYPPQTLFLFLKITFAFTKISGSPVLSTGTRPLEANHTANAWARSALRTFITTGMTMDL